MLLICLWLTPNTCFNVQSNTYVEQRLHQAFPQTGDDRHHTRPGFDARFAFAFALCSAFAFGANIELRLTARFHMSLQENAVRLGGVHLRIAHNNNTGLS
jgi:hypothetical protein